MTTTIGINAYDPNHNQPYIFLASDSLATPKKPSGKLLIKKQFNTDKIIIPENGNFILAHAGTLMSPNHLKIDLLQKQKETALLNSKNLTPKQAYFHLRRINLEINRSYIIGLSPEKMYLFMDEEMNRGAASMIGSGAEYQGEEFTELVRQINTHKDNHLPILPIKKAIEITMDQINKASTKDIGTGGYFAFGTLTKKSNFYCGEATKLRKNLNIKARISQIEKELIENLPKNQDWNTIEDIIF